MKKQIIKNILIIVLGVFIIIPLISMIFNIDFSRQEGFAAEEESYGADVTLTDTLGNQLVIIPYDFVMKLNTTSTTYTDLSKFALTSATLSGTDITSDLTYDTTTGTFNVSNSPTTYGTLNLVLTYTDDQNNATNFTFSDKLINYPFSLTDSNGVVTSIDLNNYNDGDIGFSTSDTGTFSHTVEGVFNTAGEDATTNFTINTNQELIIDKDNITSGDYTLTITRSDTGGGGSPDRTLTFNISITAVDAAAATTTETTTTYLNSINMHRVDISGVNVQHESEVDVSYTGLSGEYLYCPAGEIICKSGDPTLKTSYTLPNGQTSKTYAYVCEGGGHVECSGNRLEDGKNITLMSNCLNSLGNTTTNKYYGLTNTATTARVDSGVRVTFENDTTLAGFTDPFKYIPFEISGNNAYVYDTTQELLFTSDNCGVYENDGCFEAVTTNCDNNASSSSSSSSSSSTDDGTCPAIKCLADNGSEKGGPLCCGQSGVLQNTKYNCPADYPFCVGYKCGESWGTCQATAS
jgi:hypothetical protein